MTYRPNKTTGNFFSVFIIILGAVIVKKANPHNVSIEGLEHQPPAFLGVGLIVVGIFGLILTWSRSKRNYK
jgi:hypothetical protein